MKSLIKLVSFAIIILILSACSHKPIETLPAHNPVMKSQAVVQENPVIRLETQMMQEPVQNGEHLCMNLTAAEISQLGWPPIDPSLKSEETCNYQHIQITNVLQNVHIRQSMDIDYTEFPAAIHNILLHNVTPSADDSDTSPVTQEHYDVINVDHTQVIRDISENIASSFMKIGSTSKYIVCNLYARIPTGLIHIVHNFEIQTPYPPINLSMDTEAFCELGAHVLGILLQSHSSPDASSPNFCLNIDDDWLSMHKLMNYPNSDGSLGGGGCQDQTLTWTDLSGSERQSAENSINMQIVHGIYSSNIFRGMVIGGRDAQIWESSFESGNINTSRSVVLHIPITGDFMLVIKVNSKNLIPQAVSRLAQALAFYQLSRNITY